MEINDFSSLLQLIATFSIAFVAVEYVKSFTQALCNKYFKYDEFVTKKFSVCSEKLPDKDTLESLKPFVVGDKKNSSSNKIEAAKRDCESILKEIREKEAEMRKKMTSACLAKSMPSICFFISLTGFVLLLAGAIEGHSPDFARCFCTVFCLASVIYLIAGWCWGEKDKPKQYLNFASFRNATLGFVLLTLASAALALIICLIPVICAFICKSIWWWFLLTYVLFSFANYYIFFKKIGYSIDNLKREVNAFVSEITPRCGQSTNEIKRLLTAQEVYIEVMADNQDPVLQN